MNNYHKNPEEKSLKPVISMKNLCPQIRKLRKSASNTKVFFQENFVNNYEKYFPTSSSNITIPNGENADYISENINKKHDIFSIKGLKSTPNSPKNTKKVKKVINSSEKDYFENLAPENLYFKKTLSEQNDEITRKCRNFKGINSIKPEIKEKYRNNEVLKVTKSLLIANNEMVNDLKSDNKRILGLETQVLMRFSKYADPNLIKKSIISDNSKSYPKIQRIFGLKNVLERKNYEKKKDFSQENLQKSNTFSEENIVENCEENKNQLPINKEIELFGKKMKTKSTKDIGKGKGKVIGVSRNEIKSITAIKKVNFRKSQNSPAIISYTLKKQEKIIKKNKQFI